MAKPRHLALGVLACVIDANSACVLEAELATEMGEQLGRAVRLQSGPARIGRAIEHGAHFAQHTTGQHRVEALLDAIPEPAALRSQQGRGETPARRLTLAGLPSAERPACGEPDLPGADMALPVAGF